MKVKRIDLREQKYGYDIGLLFVTIFLCIFGLIMIYSASYYTATVKGLSPNYYLRKQLTSTLIGLALMLVMAWIPYRVFNSWLSLVASPKVAATISTYMTVQKLRGLRLANTAAAARFPP